MEQTAQRFFSTICLCCFLACGPNELLGQLKVLGGVDPEAAVHQVLLSDTPGIEILKVSYLGASQAIGTFESKFVYNEMMPSGVLMSTGQAAKAVGPNESGHTTGQNLYPGIEKLRKLAGNKKTLDAASLSFEFRALRDSISFRYFFASEEYPEYVNRGVSDVFGFFLLDKTTGKRRNLAVLKDGETTICVDNIHSKKNAKLFMRNGLWNSANMKALREDSAVAERALFLEYDGCTVVLETGAVLVPGRIYELEMAIADVGDNNYDSAIFLEAGSFKGHGGKIEEGELELMVLFEEGLQTETNQVQKGVRSIEFEFASAVVADTEDLIFLEELAAVIKQGNWQRIEVIGHTDSVGSEAENLVLSLKRALNIVAGLTRLGVPSGMLEAKGMGEGEPLDVNNGGKNRRVEFVFYAEN